MWQAGPTTFSSSKFSHLQTRSWCTPITSWYGIESHVPCPCTSGRPPPCALPVTAPTFPHPGFRVSPAAPSAYPRLMKQPGEAGDFFSWRRVDLGDRYRACRRSDTHPSIPPRRQTNRDATRAIRVRPGQKDSHDRSQKLQNTDWHAKLSPWWGPWPFHPSIHLSATVVDAPDCRLTLLVWQASSGFDWARKSSTFSC
jgi:hypothetical protein